MINFDKLVEGVELDRDDAIRSRKNVGAVHRLVFLGMEKGVLKPGQSITSRGVREAIGEKAIAKMFDQVSGAADAHGATRSIGDLLGDHGLGLRKIKRSNKSYFIIPKKLPKVLDDCVMEEAVYE